MIVSGDGPWERPASGERCAASPAIEARIATAAARIGDPGLRRLLANSLSNTLDTTVEPGGSDDRPDTFVRTGDIDAMWLRDSTAQVWPYVASAREDSGLDRLLRGVIRRQALQVLLDPYANAFERDERPGPWATDEPAPRPGVHERKWEPDSIAAFLRLSAGYAAASNSMRPFDADWRGALELSLATLRREQRLHGGSPYRFHRPAGSPLDTLPEDGDVAPSRPNGMVHGAFRPSDDAGELPLNVPVNLALAAALEQVAPVAASTGASASAQDALALAAEIRAAVKRDGMVKTAHGTAWAYEVDGLGGRVLMDDANVPSLLSLPYLGACEPGDPVYLATRRLVLSAANPWWSEGPAGEGIGSPHTGPARVWPIAIAVRGLTARDAAERVAACRLLGATHAGTFLAHEAFDVHDPARYSRPWFSWACSLAGELLETSANQGLLG